MEDTAVPPWRVMSDFFETLTYHLIWNSVLSERSNIFTDDVNSLGEQEKVKIKMKKSKGSEELKRGNIFCCIYNIYIYIYNITTVIDFHFHQPYTVISGLWKGLYWAGKLKLPSLPCLRFVWFFFKIIENFDLLFH